MLNETEVSAQYNYLVSLLPPAENSSEQLSRDLALVGLNLLQDLHLKITKISEK